MHSAECEELAFGSWLCWRLSSRSSSVTTSRRHRARHLKGNKDSIWYYTVGNRSMLTLVIFDDGIRRIQFFDGWDQTDEIRSHQYLKSNGFDLLSSSTLVHLPTKITKFQHLYLAQIKWNHNEIKFCCGNEWYRCESLRLICVCLFHK